MVPAVRPTDATRLKADLAAARVELLSAQCAADRVRLQYSIPDIVASAERQALKQAIASAEALYRFFSQLGPRSNAKRTTATGTGRRFPLRGSGIATQWQRSKQSYFSTRTKSPVEALTATVSLAVSRLAP